MARGRDADGNLIVTQEEEMPETGVEMVMNPLPAKVEGYALWTVTKVWQGIQFRAGVTDTTFGFNLEPMFGTVVFVAVPTRPDPPPLAEVMEDAESVMTYAEFLFMQAQFMQGQVETEMAKRQALENAKEMHSDF